MMYEGKGIRRVLITGSRDWTDKSEVRLRLFELLCEAMKDGDVLTVVHGDCPTGADAIASDWCDTGLRIGFADNLIEEKHAADWDTHGRAAGPIRNQQMVDLGADLCLAFPLESSRGTIHCIRAAFRAGIEVETV